MAKKSKGLGNPTIKRDIKVPSLSKSDNPFGSKGGNPTIANRGKKKKRS